jgi:hypothetical protein
MVQNIQQQLFKLIINIVCVYKVVKGKKISYVG